MNYIYNSSREDDINKIGDEEVEELLLEEQAELDIEAELNKSDFNEE